MRVVVIPAKGLLSALDSIRPSSKRSNFRRALLALAFRVQELASGEFIKRGGGVSKRGPESPPERGRLTSRTGTLRRSIRVDRSELPFAVEIGTDLAYAPPHELGLRVSVPASRVRAHTRRSAFGRRTRRPFVVPEHERRSYTAAYPKRPFLAPAARKAQGEGAVLVAAQIAADVESARREGGR